MTDLAARSAPLATDCSSVDTLTLPRSEGRENSAFEFRGVRCFPDPENASSWFYLPRHPGLRREPTGTPMVSIAELGHSAHLSFTATWGPDAASLETLRSEIATRTGEHRPNSLRLSFVPLSECRCDAIIRDDFGEFGVLAANATSGFPPYDTVFSVALLPGQRASARAALDGAVGLLAIDYSAVARIPTRGSTTLTVFNTSDAHLTETVRACADIGKIVARASTRAAPGGPHAAD